MTQTINPAAGAPPAAAVGVGLAAAAAGAVVAAPVSLPGMGAVVAPNGCTFRVWAPNATEVFVAGDFTAPAWDGGKIALGRDSGWGGSPHHWSAFVPGVADGAEYKFVVKRGTETNWRLDPYGRDATAHGGNSVVRDPAFDWGTHPFRMPPRNETVLYELHVGTFNRDPAGVGTFADLVDDELPYLRDLGVNAIEILPISDFGTDTSMGYNPALLFAIEDGYGDSKAFRKFVRAAHERDIAVIADVVYNHFGPEGLGGCLWQFDGWSWDNNGGVYFYTDDRAVTDYGDENRPDFGRPEVRQFIRDNAMMWLHDYRLDGLRVDSTVNIRRAIGKGTDRGELADGWALMQWFNADRDREQPWKLTIAEDLQNNEWLTKPVGAGGAGFSAQWDSSFYHAVVDALKQPRDEWRDLERVKNAIYNRYNGDAFQRVIYTESHDEVTVQNGVDLGRVPRKIDWNDAEGWHARKRSTLGAALVFTSPGVPMIFQGQEFLEWWTWTDRTPLDWAKEHRFAGIKRLYQDLIKLRRNWYDNTRGLRGQHVNVFHVDHAAKVIAFHRWADGGPGDDVVVVANFSAARFDSYNVGFPRAGTWHLRFNSDWRGYAGDFGDAGYTTTAGGGGNQGMPFDGNVGVGPYSAIVLSQ